MEGQEEGEEEDGAGTCIIKQLGTERQTRPGTPNASKRKVPNAKKPCVPWKGTGCFLAWAPTVFRSGCFAIDIPGNRTPASNSGVLIHHTTIGCFILRTQIWLNCLGQQAVNTCGPWCDSTAKQEDTPARRTPPHLEMPTSRGTEVLVVVVVALGLGMQL